METVEESKKERFVLTFPSVCHTRGTNRIYFNGRTKKEEWETEYYIKSQFKCENSHHIEITIRKEEEKTSNNQK